MSDFAQSMENCRVVAFNKYPKKDGSVGYEIGILQGREHCGMLGCDEKLGQQFDPKSMFDKLCRVTFRNISNGSGSWTIVTDIEMIKPLDGK